MFFGKLSLIIVYHHNKRGSHTGVQELEIDIHRGYRMEEQGWEKS